MAPSSQGDPWNPSVHLPQHHLRDVSKGKRRPSERWNIFFKVRSSTVLNDSQHFWIIQSLYPIAYRVMFFSPLRSWWGRGSLNDKINIHILLCAILLCHKSGFPSMERVPAICLPAKSVRERENIIGSLCFWHTLWIWVDVQMSSHLETEEEKEP